MGSCRVFTGPSCHLNHKVKKCGSKSGQERKPRWRWCLGCFFIFWARGDVVFDHLLYQVSPVADERIISILRHQNLLKELQEIAAQGTVSLQLFGMGGFHLL